MKSLQSIDQTESYFCLAIPKIHGKVRFRLETNTMSRHAHNETYISRSIKQSLPQLHKTHHLYPS